jgi:hypothetical protein
VEFVGMQDVTLAGQAVSLHPAIAE